MRGLPEFNFPAFHLAAATLRSRGYEVWSPAEADIELDDFDPKTDEAKPFAYYMKRDLAAVCDVEAVVCLPGWQQSQGARLETYVARAIGLPVLSYPTLEPARHPGSDRFHELVQLASELHDRKQADYGSGGDPFANVRASSEWGIPPWVGALVRLNDKVTRLKSFARKGFLSNESAYDSLQDIAVYALIAYVLLEEEEEKDSMPAVGAIVTEHGDQERQHEYQGERDEPERGVETQPVDRDAVGNEREDDERKYYAGDH